jgi:hypothetical protein
MRLLLLDIETAPNIAHVWGLWQQNVGLNQLIDAGYVLCWAAKWYGEKEVMFDSIHRSKPEKMLKRVHKLLSECDAVIHYNGKSFDIPTLNKEFIIREMTPPPPYKQVDLCQVAKSTFRFPSNKLAYIAKALGVAEKKNTRGHELWVGCMANDKECWTEMEDYNRGDVVTLEEVYERMRPWIRLHPNHGLYDEPGIPVCTNCGSGRLQRRGFSRSVVSKYARWCCKDCGTWVRGADQELPKEDRQKIMRRVV